MRNDFSGTGGNETGAIGPVLALPEDGALPQAEETSINVDILHDSAIIAPVAEADYLAERKAKAEDLLRKLR